MIGIRIRLNAIDAVYKTATIDALASLAKRLLPALDTATRQPPTNRYVKAIPITDDVKSDNAEPSSYDHPMLASESSAVGSYLCQIPRNPQIAASKNQPVPYLIQVLLPLPGSSLNRSTRPTGALFIKNNAN